MPRASTAAEAGPFEFVVGNRPDQLNGHATSRLRSHLSKRGWRGVLSSSAAKSSASATSSSPQSSSSSSSLSPSCNSGEVFRRAKRSRRPREEPVVALGTLRRSGSLADPNDALTSDAVEESQVTDVSASHPPQWTMLASSRPMSIEYRLGGGRVDPFHAHPGPWKPYIPALTDHYIVHMAVDIPELDEPGRAGLLRTRWYPLVLSDPSTFATVLLLSAANYITTMATGCPDSTHSIPRSSTSTSMSTSSSSSSSSSTCLSASTLSPSTSSATTSSIDTVEAADPLKDSSSPFPDRRHILHLRQAAIGAINAAMRDPRRRLSDELVGAVAKMASFEAMHGDLDAYRAHMEGLRVMLALRGGVASLGLGGLLRRMIVWIDLNASFLLGVDRYFPDLTFAGGAAMDLVEEPNPARFIAIR